MTPLLLRLGLFSFAVLSSAVLVNVFYLQPVSGVRGAPAGEAGLTGAQVAMTVPVKDEQVFAAPAVGGGPSVEITRAVQRELQARGYAAGGGGEGSAGVVMRAAIMAYEFDHGLAMTAEPSEELLRSIVLGTASADVPPVGPLKVGPAAEMVIRAAQQGLARLNYAPLSLDGRLSETMTGAIRRFERDHGLAVTGRLSGELVAKLAALGKMPHQK